MSHLRQDAWTEAEDHLLAELVLKHIREGSTQLAAFQEVSEQLSRTPAACGFRWNATVRKRYEKEIKLAKEQRIPVKENAVTSDETERTELTSLTLHDVIEFLNGMAVNDQSKTELVEENKKLKREIEMLRKQYSETFRNLTIMNEMLNKDYKTFIETMEKAKNWGDEDEADMLGSE